MGTLDYIVLILVLIGGLNWGLIGFLDYDLVASLFGDMSMISRIVYDLVGLSALYMIFMFSKMDNQ